MGLNNRDKQTKLKTQSLLDSERTGQQTVTTVTVDHGTVAMPLESMAISSSTSNNSSTFQQSSSSSSTSKIQSSAVEKVQKSSDGRISEVREQLGSKKDGQKFSTVSSIRSEANKSKQIDNIIEEIHHIASDTIGTTALIGASAGMELPTKVTQRSVLVSGGDSARKESFISESVAAGGGHTTVSNVSGDAIQQVISTIGPSKIEISKMALDSSALSSTLSSSNSKVTQSSSSAITKKEQQQSSSSSHSAMRNEKNVSESSAISSSHKSESKMSKSSNTTSSSSSSSKSMSTAQSGMAQSVSETFQSSEYGTGDNVQSSQFSVNGRQRDVLSFDGRQSSSTVQPHLPDHSTFDQKSFQQVDGDGKTRQQLDSQSYSMAQSQKPTTKILYDAAGNQITSTSASYHAAQGHSTSSFQRSDGVDLKSARDNTGTAKLFDLDSKMRQTANNQNQVMYDAAGKQNTSSSSSYQTAHGYSSSSFQNSEAVDSKASNDVTSSSSTSTKRSQNVSSSKGMTSTTLKDSIIDSTTLDNYSLQQHDSSTGQHVNNMLMKTESAHTVASLSSAHDSLASTIQSTQLITESASEAQQRQQHSESTKTYETSSHSSQMDEESRSRRKTSEYREQRESNAAILKRKTYDEYGRRLNLIDEKIVPKDTVTADLQDDVTNVTKTSFEAKMFNPKLKRWELVDQKTILEKDITTDIPMEIVRELEVERPELANITTTIQMTKVYDAKTKQWKTIDHKKHIDVLEKITFLEENSGRSELDESERTKNLKSMDMVDRVTIKEVSDLSEEKRNKINKTSKRKDQQTIQEQCICEICTCGRHNCYNCGGGSATTQTKSSKYTATSNSENFYHQENFTSELSEHTSSGRRGTWTIEDAEEHLNRNDSYTIERSSTEHESTARRLTWTKEDFDKVDVTKLKAEQVRPKPIKHEDNLRPEGDFERPEKSPFRPAERREQ
uniref:Uncharacterized protein n=1 Tax=Anopheles christyi TaxID=43041 RepID=A0A182KDS0_9DIPT